MFKALGLHFVSILAVVVSGYIVNALLARLNLYYEVPSFVTFYIALFTLSLLAYQSPKIKRYYDEAKQK